MEIRCYLIYRWTIYGTALSGNSDRIMECVDGITINFCTTSSRTNGNVFNSTWSSRGHINSVIRLMGDWLNEHAIKKPLVTQLTCRCKPMLLDRDIITPAFTVTRCITTHTEIQTAETCRIFKASKCRGWKSWLQWLSLVTSMNQWILEKLSIKAVNTTQILTRFISHFNKLNFYSIRIILKML